MPRLRARVINSVAILPIIHFAALECHARGLKADGEAPDKAAAPAKMVIEPLLGKATLEIGKQIIKPLQVMSPWQVDYWAADRRMSPPRQPGPC